MTVIPRWHCNTRVGIFFMVKLGPGIWSQIYVKIHVSLNCYGYVTCILTWKFLIMSTMASQITGVTIIYSTVWSGADQRKHQRSASLVCVKGIHQWLGQYHRKYFHLMTSSWTFKMSPPNSQMRRPCYLYNTYMNNLQTFFPEALGCTSGIQINHNWKPIGNNTHSPLHWRHMDTWHLKA